MSFLFKLKKENFLREDPISTYYYIEKKKIITN